MNYTEYKQAQNQGTSASQVPSIKLDSLESYLEARKQCERFEMKQITDELTAEDFTKYEANLYKILEQLNYTDEESEIYESELERVARHMDLVGWTWYGREKSPNAREIQRTIEDHFITCMQAGKPIAMCSSGGVTVKTNIYLHTVEVSFDLFAMGTDDETEDTWG